LTVNISGGGAGVQADIEDVTMLGGYAATAITAVTVQNTLGVSGAFPMPPTFIAAQAQAVLDDIGADVIKTGMLGDAEVVEMVARLLDGAGVPAVIDPVMVAKGGARLLADDAIAPLKTLLVPRALCSPQRAGGRGADRGGGGEPRRPAARRRGAAADGAGAVMMKGGPRRRSQGHRTS